MKKYFKILTVAALLAIGAFVAIILLFGRHEKIEEIRFRTETLKLNDDGTYSFTNADISHSIYKTDQEAGTFGNIIKLFEGVDLQKSDSVPSDVQLVEFSCYSSEKNSRECIETYVFAYDFYCEKLYAFRDGEWLLMQKNEALDSLIVEFLDVCLKYRTRWLGQSTFAPEEFLESDFENQTFRYNLYWRSEVWLSGQDDFRKEGFANTAPIEIKSKEDASRQAAKELGFVTPVTSVFYDETCGYWLVEIFENSDSLDFSDLTNDKCDALYEGTYSVIMNDKGVTLEIYRGVTRFLAFRTANTDDGSPS